MSDKTLRYIIALPIAMLLIFQIGSVIAGIFGIGRYLGRSRGCCFLFSARLAKAGGKRSLWFLLPTLVFTVIPISLMVGRGMTEDASWLDRLIMLTPFIVGFGAPIVLLLVYYELRKRSVSG